MNSQSPIKRLISIAACGILALFTLINVIDFLDVIKYYDFLYVLMQFASFLTLLAFCGLAILRGDNKDPLVSISLAAYAVIHAILPILKSFDTVKNDWFSVDYLILLVFYVILCLFAIKEFLPAALKEQMQSPMVQMIAVVLIWAIPLYLNFLSPLFKGADVELEWYLIQLIITYLAQSVAFTWFIKD